MPRCVAAALLALALISVAYYCINKELGSPRIHNAVRHGDLAKIRALLQDDPTLVSSKDNQGMTPLFQAPNKDVAELPLAKGADANGNYSYAWTPAHLAAINRHPDVVALLHQHGGWE